MQEEPETLNIACGHVQLFLNRTKKFPYMKTMQVGLVKIVLKQDDKRVTSQHTTSCTSTNLLHFVLLCYHDALTNVL